jgi:hypothetical protein
MQTQMTRMKPDSANMVTQAGTSGTIEILCTECGWEGTSVLPTAPWVIFKDHNCRLIVRSVSTLF